MTSTQAAARDAAWHVLPLRSFSDHRQTWLGLNRRCGNSALLDTHFLEPLFEQFAEDGDRLAISGDPSEPLAMAVLRRTGRFTWQTLQPANAPIGPLLIAPGLSPDAVLPGLAKRLDGFPLLLGLSQQDPDILPRPAESERLSTLDYIATARITVPGDFDSYWGQRGKNLRHNIKRQHNKLSREGIVMRFEAVTEPDRMADAVDDYAGLEMSGWKGQEGSAVQPDDHQGRFYKKMLRGFAEQGEAVVYRYFFQDELVSSDICLLRDGELIILKTAYDESRKGISPSQLMRFDAFRVAFDDGTVKKVEFFGPVKDWHTKWSDEVRTMYHVNWYRWPAVARYHQSKAA